MSMKIRLRKAVDQGTPGNGPKVLVRIVEIGLAVTEMTYRGHQRSNFIAYSNNLRSRVLLPSLTFGVTVWPRCTAVTDDGQTDNIALTVFTAKSLSWSNRSK